MKILKITLSYLPLLGSVVLANYSLSKRLINLNALCLLLLFIVISILLMFSISLFYDGKFKNNFKKCVRPAFFLTGVVYIIGYFYQTLSLL